MCSGVVIPVFDHHNFWRLPQSSPRASKLEGWGADMERAPNATARVGGHTGFFLPSPILPMAHSFIRTSLPPLPMASELRTQSHARGEVSPGFFLQCPVLPMARSSVRLPLLLLQMVQPLFYSEERPLMDAIAFPTCLPPARANFGIISRQSASIHGYIRPAQPRLAMPLFTHHPTWRRHSSPIFLVATY